jgi:competence transcription factor ComK
MWIEIPCLYYPDDYDPEQSDILKTKVKLIPGFLTINHEQICSYNKMDNGHVLIHMTNGDLIESPVKINSFRDVIGEIEARMELVISNEN